MIAVDTSVVVAGFASWHEAHASAAAVLARRPRIPAHALIEAYSVLTRLPPPHRAPADVVATFLEARFSDGPLVLPGRRVQSLLATVAGAGLAGGSIYDALIGATAAHAEAVLITRDRRASSVYELVGARFEVLI